MSVGSPSFCPLLGRLIVRVPRGRRTVQVGIYVRFFDSIFDNKGPLLTIPPVRARRTHNF
jgi:hypothetical protein